MRAREAGTLALVLVVFALVTLKNHDFASAGSIQQLLVGASLVALLAVGETMVLVTRNVDLSVGSTLGLCAFVVGNLFRTEHIPVWSGFVIAIALGALVGAINGLITVVIKVPSLVVTLAMLYIVRGLDSKLVNGSIVVPSQVPHAFIDVGFKTVLGIPYLAIIVAAVVIIVGYAMRTFRPAREMYAIGSSPEAAMLAGIPSARRVFAAFVTSGALAGLGGALFLALFAQVDNSAGTGYELERHRRRGGRRGRDLRRQRHRRGRGLRRAAAQHHPAGPRRGPQLVLLGRGDRGRPAARRHRHRPVAEPARCPGPAVSGRSRTVTSDMAPSNTASPGPAPDLVPGSDPSASSPAAPAVAACRPLGVWPGRGPHRGPRLRLLAVVDLHHEDHAVLRGLDTATSR